MIIKSEIVLPNVYVLTYDTQYDLCMSFVRMQEYYESPSSKIRGKKFTLEEYMDYWADNFGNGSFDYVTRWNGFNLPSKIIEQWNSKYQLEEIRDREWEMLEIIESLRELESEDGVTSGGLYYPILPEKYYVIGVHAETSEKYRQDVIDHESAHALYYLYLKYKRSANKLLKEISDNKIEMASWKLKEMGYGKNVEKDEMQAYFSTEPTKRTGSSLIGLVGMKKFAENFNKYRQKWIDEKK